MEGAEYNDLVGKKLLTALGALTLLLGAAYGILSLRWHPTRGSGPPRLEAVARGAGPLLAGASVVPLDPPAPVPVAGYARLHWMEEGRRDPVSVRAIVLQEPGCTVALVSLEILLVPGDLQRAIERRLRDLHLDQLVVAATHTHAGPGGFWNEPLGERVATGPYSEAVFDDLVRRSAQAVREAHDALEPAYLSVGRGLAPSLVWNRGGGAVDGRLVSARLTGLSGREVGEIVLYPSHGTLLGLDNRRVSGDWPGALMRARKEPLLFFQGAVGDQSPSRRPGSPEAYARALAERLDDLHRDRPDPWPDLAVATVSEILPPADFGASPPFLRRVARNLLHDLLPDRARVVAIRLGPLTLLAVPAEPVAEVGRRWRAAAGEGAEILSLAGDYLGYVETSERMAEMAGETVHTYYGPELADRLAGAVKVAAEAVRPRQAAPGVAAAR
jgi:neutral ceramidase